MSWLTRLARSFTPDAIPSPASDDGLATGPARAATAADVFGLLGGTKTKQQSPKGFEKELPPAVFFAKTHHPGVENPLKEMSVDLVTPEIAQAILTYIQAEFRHSDPAAKAAVIDTMSELLTPPTVAALRELHLPQAFNGTGAPITCALENERMTAVQYATGYRASKIFDYYAPDPSGELFPELIPDEWLPEIVPQAMSARAWRRMSDDAKRGALRWRDLPKDHRFVYCKALQEKLDDRVEMYRIKDAGRTSVGRVLPDTLSGQLHWERVMECAEVITADHYVSLDQLFADIGEIKNIDPEQPSGFHVHQVVEFASKEEGQELGPHVVGWAALIDALLFVRSVKASQSPFSNTSLEVFTQEGLHELSDHVREHGRVIEDEMCHHKLHMGGVRSGIYGDDARMGLETRGVIMGQTRDLLTLVTRTNLVFSDPEKLKAVPPPPWDGWNAGDAQALQTAFEAYVAKPNAIVGADDPSFAELLELAGEENKAGLVFQMALPFWNIEALPGVTAKEKVLIDKARNRATDQFARLSRAVARAQKNGRVVDGAQIRERVIRINRSFVKQTNIDRTLARTIGRISKGRNI